MLYLNGLLRWVRFLFLLCLLLIASQFRFSMSKEALISVFTKAFFFEILAHFVLLASDDWLRLVLQRSYVGRLFQRLFLFMTWWCNIRLNFLMRLNLFRSWCLWYSRWLLLVWVDAIKFIEVTDKFIVIFFGCINKYSNSFVWSSCLRNAAFLFLINFLISLLGYFHILALIVILVLHIIDWIAIESRYETVISVALNHAIVFIYLPLEWF